MASTLVRKLLLSITADDADAEEKLDRISEKADELAEKHPDLKVRIDTAAATAKMAVLREELKSLNDTGESGGFLSSMSEGISGLMENIPLVGGMLSSLAGTGPIGAAAAVGVLVTAIGAALTELTGLVAGLTAVGLGAGAFAALAYPAFEAVKNAMGDTSAQLKKLPADERGAVLGIRQLEGAYKKMAAEFKPVVFKVFSDGLKVANNLLPTLKQPATDFGNALDGILKQLGKFTASKQFKAWLGEFEKDIGPATTAIGDGLGRVAGSFGKLMTAMSSHDVVHALNIAFDAISGTISAITGIVKFFMIVYDNMSQAVKDAGRDIVGAMKTVGGSFESLGGSFATLWGQIRSGIDTGVGWFKALPGRIMSALGNLGSQMFSFGAHIISQLASGIASAAGSVIGSIGRIAGDIADHIPHSPAKRGPLSGSGDPTLAGRKIAQMLGQGMRMGIGDVTGGASAMARAAGLTAGGGRIAGAGGGGAGGVQRIQFEFVGADSAMSTAMKKMIRVRGGDPQVIGR